MIQGTVSCLQSTMQYSAQSRLAKITKVCIINFDFTFYSASLIILVSVLVLVNTLNSSTCILEVLVKSGICAATATM